MKIHVIQTGNVRARPMQPFGAPTILHRFAQILFSSKWTEWLPIYSWLIEHPGGPILIDVGETSRINDEGYLPNNFLYHKAVQTKISKDDEIDIQLKKVGFKLKDIQRVVLTHLHGDHVGGLYLFPHCRFQVGKAEYDFAGSDKGPGMGYFNHNWPDWFTPELIEFEKRKDGVFDESFVLTDDEDIIAVPTPGHSIGHLSIIVHSAKAVISGDAVFNQETLIKEIPSYVLPNKEGKRSVKLLNQYIQDNGYTLLSSHDDMVPELLQKINR